MNTLKLVLLSSLFSVNAWAATAEVTWHEPESYRDIRASNEIESRFQARVFAELEKHFESLAEQLPDNQVLKIVVTDVDLAGEIELQPMNGGLGSLRIVRGFDFPSMKFSYELVTAEGKIIVQGEERIRGRDVPGKGRPYRRSAGAEQMLAAEYAMLDRWFRFRFKDELK